MKKFILPSLAGAVVYFLVIHFLFGKSNLDSDLVSAAFFFVITLLVNWAFQKHSKKRPQNDER